jgi:hypothetical protein
MGASSMFKKLARAHTHDLVLIEPRNARFRPHALEEADDWWGWGDRGVAMASQASAVQRIEPGYATMGFVCR